MFIYIWERQKQRQSTSRRGAEREGDRIWSRLQALSCQHRAWCRAWTHKQWAHDLSRSQMLNWLSHPGAPRLANLTRAYPDSSVSSCGNHSKGTCPWFLLLPLLPGPPRLLLLHVVPYGLPCLLCLGVVSNQPYFQWRLSPYWLASPYLKGVVSTL